MNRKKMQWKKRMISLFLSMLMLVTSITSPVLAEELAMDEIVISTVEQDELLPAEDADASVEENSSDDIVILDEVTDAAGEETASGEDSIIIEGIDIVEDEPDDDAAGSVEDDKEALILEDEIVVELDSAAQQSYGAEESSSQETAAAYLLENYVTNYKIITNGGDSVVKSEDGLTYRVGLKTSSGSPINSLRFKTEGSSSEYRFGWYLTGTDIDTYITSKSATSTSSRSILKRDTKEYSFTATLKLFASDTENTAINEGTAQALASQEFTIILEPEAAKYKVTFQAVNKNTRDVISGADISLEKDWSEVLAESDGSYILPGDAIYSLTVTADGYQKYTNSAFQAAADGTVTIELSPIVKHAITFDIKDSKGNPVEGASVVVKQGYYTTVSAQEDGSYLLEEGTSYSYTVSAANYNNVTGTINPSEDECISVTMTKNISSYQVTIKVATEDGTEISGAAVAVSYMDYDWDYEEVEVPVTPDSNGVYSLSKGEAYTISVTAEGYQPVTETYTPSGEEEAITKTVTLKPTVAVDPADQAKVDALKAKYDAEFGALRPSCGTDANINAFVLKKLQGYTDTDSEGVTVSLKSTGDANYIQEDGTISYNRGVLKTSTNVVNVSCTFRFHCGNAVAETNARTVTIGWDRSYFNEKIQEEAERLTKESITEANSGLDFSAVTADFLLQQCMGTSLLQVWSVIDWSSSDESVISLADTGYGSKIDSKKAVVHAPEKDTTVTLTATFKANDAVLNTNVESVDDFTPVIKNFDVTVKGTGTAPPTEAELQAILNTYYPDSLLKEYDTDNPVDLENCQTDIQLPRYTKIKDTEGNLVFANKEITVTSDNTDVIAVNGYRANVDIFQEAPATVNLIVTFTRENVSVSRTIPVKVGVITNEMLDAEIVMMEAAKAHYFDGINDQQYADKDSITGNLHAFQEMTLDAEGNPVWAYNIEAKTGQGIIPDDFFDDSFEMESAGYNKFKSSNNAVIQHENLLVTRPEGDTEVTISSLLSSERYGKFAPAHPKNEKLQKLYKQSVEVTVTVKGTSDAKAVLESKIAEAEEILSSMKEGTEAGQYAAGTKAELESAVNAAKAVLTKEDATESDYNSAVQALTAALTQAEEKQNVVSADITIASVLDTTSGKPDYTVKQSVKADEAQKAGYQKPDAVKNQVTVLDALVVLHREIFGEKDFNESPTTYLNVNANGWITTIFGETTGNVAFYVNHTMPEDTCDTCVLQSGDQVCVMLYSDTTGHSDKYLFMEAPSETITAGDTFSITVQSAEYTGSIPVAGCQVTLTDPEGTTEDGTTDDTGSVSFTAEKAGTYTAEITKAPYTYYAVMGAVSIKVKDAKDKDISGLVSDGTSGALDYISEIHSENGYAYGNEWLVFAQIRAGQNMDEEVLNAYYTSAAAKVTSWDANQKPTDLERVALTLTSMGKNITNVEGVNLAAMIYNSPRLGDGSNELAYALLALDAGDITIPADAAWNRNAILAELLKFQNPETGGFGLSDNKSASVDMTAMVLQALANYQNRAEVKAATEKALAYLKNQLNDDYGYGTSEATAQVLLALSLLGIDPAQKESGFGTPNANMITNLTEDYRTSDGGYSHLPRKSNANEMSTVQVLQALSAYQRMKDGKQDSYWNVNGVKAEITFTLWGDDVHDSDEDQQIHIWKDRNLQEWIPVTVYRVAEGITVKEVLETALTENDMTWENVTGNYVSSITREGETLGEFTNGKKSGWLYELNGVHPEIGVAEQTLKDGDTVVFHYTDDYMKEYPHEHKWQTSWSSDDSYHWHECIGSRGECSAAENSEKQGYGAHTGNWTVTSPATCTASGTEIFTCSVCGYTKTRTVAATGHQYGEWKVTKQPSCTAAGTETSTCAACGDTRTRTVAATGHQYGKWTTVTKATVFAPETQKRSCSVCGQTETRNYGSKLTPTVKVSTTKVSLYAGKNTTRVKVTGLANGDSVTSWKSGNTKIFTVSGKSDGTCQIKAKSKAGTAKLTITLASGVKKTVSVTVKLIKTKKISGLKSKMTLKKGKTTTLKPVLTPSNSQEKITYSSSNKKVVTVSSKGVLKAKAAGTAKITVKSGSKKFVVKVTVPKTKTTKITGVKKSITVKKGKSYTLKAKLTPAKSDEKITYKSSNKKVATVTSKGVVKGIKKGTATITVTSGDVSVKCKVTVN